MFSSILQKPLGAITVLGTAIGGPYALFETDAGTVARSLVQGVFDASQSGPGTLPTAEGPVSDGGTPLAPGILLNEPGTPAVPSWTPPPIYDLREVIRFDMTPTALPQRFAQITTITSDPRFDTYRVPLVTGTGPTDLVGTLTYSFDANKTVQRIQWVGTTADPAMIAGMMVQYYGLRPESSLGGQLFTTRWNNRITSLLHVRPASVMSAAAPHSNYQVFLELNQPSPYYGLSEEAYRAAGIAPTPERTNWFGF